MDWNERITELVQATEKAKGNCCGDVLNLYAEDLEKLLASFASEVERLTRQAQSQALQQLAELTAADVYTPHGMYDDMRCFFCGADEGVDHKDDCTWILARGGVAVASSQGGEQK